MASDNKQPGVTLLHSTLRFDPVRESYIIEAIDRLKSQGKLTDYLNDLFRLAFETPELINTNTALLDMMASYGVSPCAKEFFEEKAKEITEMHHKIDEIYQMCLEMYTLTKFGKSIGLDKKSQNMARAEFMLERQVNEICHKLGIVDKNVFKSAKIPNIEQQSENILDYIITHYDGIVKEISADVTPVKVPVAYQFDTLPIPDVESENEVDKQEKTTEKSGQNTEFGDDVLETFDECGDSAGILSLFDF